MKSPVLVALDYPDRASVMALVSQLSPRYCRLKVGKELFTRCGPQLVDELQQLGFEIFLDLKYHDIPNTVAGAVRAAAELGVWMVNVHAGGGRRMMEAAAAAIADSAHKPLLIAVTVLTSMSDEDLAEMGYSETAEQRVLRLARLAQQSGMDGVVCSAMEAPMLRDSCGDDFCLVTPGIRLAGDDSGDQRRVVTPVDAMAKGSSYLVIGRSITGSTDPLQSLKTIHEQLGLAE